VDIISLAWNLHHREPRFSVSVDTPLSLVYVEEMHDLLDKVLERNGSLGQVLLLQVFYQNTPELFTDAHMRKVEDAISNYYDELDLRLPDGTVTVDENTLEQLQSDEKLFFLQGLITANLIPQRYAGEISLLWSDGKEQMRAKFDNGKPHGKLEVYSPQQKLILQETYLGGLPEGQSTLFYTSGQVAEQKAYSNGKPQGPVRQYYSDGLLKAEYYYEDGELNGSYKEYGRNGELILEQNYVYGLPIQNQGESE
jgi:antitoxin component YwqK of YwqJK toxin-antitoxin module